MEEVEVRQIDHSVVHTVARVQILLYLPVLLVKQTDSVNNLIQKTNRDPVIDDLEETPFPTRVPDSLHNLYWITLIRTVADAVQVDDGDMESLGIIMASLWVIVEAELLAVEDGGDGFDTDFDETPHSCFRIVKSFQLCLPLLLH